MAFTKEELLAEKARRQKAKAPQFTREELLAEKARRDNVKATATPETPQTASKGDDGVFEFSEMIKNIPGSGAGVAEDAINTVLNPIDTINAIGDAASGGVQKVVGEGAFGLDEENIAVADSVVTALDERYGSVDNALRTAEADPVGMLFDLSGIVTGGATTAGKAGMQVAKVAKAANPVNLVKNTVKATPKVLPDSIPESMFERAAKFSTTIDSDQRKRMVKTALKEKIPLTESGLNRLDSVITEQMTKIDGILEKAEAAGKTIPKGQLLAAARAARNRVNKVVVPESAKRISQFDRVIDDLGNQWKDVKSLTPTQAQSLKQELDKVIRFDKKQLQSKIGTDDARMAIRTQTKESLEGLDPEVKTLNARTGDALELKKQLERVVSRVENRNPISLTDGAATTTGAVLGGNVGALAGLVMSGLAGPQRMSRIATKLSEIKGTPLEKVYFDSNGNLSEAFVQALVQSGRLEESEESESF